jgi:hypothetical protein
MKTEKFYLYLDQPSYIIARDTPYGRVVISGTYKHKDNAVKELKKRIAFAKNQDDGLSGWSEPYLLEFTPSSRKVEL